MQRCFPIIDGGFFSYLTNCSSVAEKDWKILKIEDSDEERFQRKLEKNFVEHKHGNFGAICKSA